MERSPVYLPERTGATERPDPVPDQSSPAQDPNPRTSVLDQAEARRLILQIRAQALQVMPQYDAARPRPSYEFGAALATIVGRIDGASKRLLEMIGGA
jgi:hypothetical protein